MGTLHREPLVHFLVLGALFFAAFAVLDDTPAGDPRHRLDVTEADAARLRRQFEATTRRPPSQAELSNLIDRYIREEVLVREAQALSLDRNDEVIRQRLVQQMQVLIESSGDVAAPTEADLRAHFARNADRFAAAPLVAFEQLQLGPGAPNADTVLAAIRSGSDPGTFGQESPLPRDIPPVSRQVVDGTFGEGFFDQLARLQVGQWSGPIQSAYGVHLVRVSFIDLGHRLSFEQARQEIEQDWRRARAEERYDAILSRYQITRPDAGAPLPQ